MRGHPAGTVPAVPRIWDDFLSTGLTHSYPVLCALAIRYLGGADIGPPDTSRFERAALDESSLPIWRLRQALSRAYNELEVALKAGGRAP